MNLKPFILAIVFGLMIHLVYCQDTFSMVAVDPETGEVGSAGASCVDLTMIQGLTDHFLGELFPGVGAINTQAAYVGGNQANARERMQAGDNAQEIIDWVVSNDISNNPTTRQYGVVKIVGDTSESAAHTGNNAFDYKGHRLGPNYAIQGNILLGPGILDSMEARFLRTEGDLACKMMAAMQGANVVGADSRCTPNGTSSLFAFLKIAQKDDEFGEPSFVISMRSEDNSGIEPIDSLQVLFDQNYSCIISSSNNRANDLKFEIHPNPARKSLRVELESGAQTEIHIFDVNGQLILHSDITGNAEINIEDVTPGFYSLKLVQGANSSTKKLIIQ